MTNRSGHVAVIIEDDEDISNLLEAVLEQAGFTTYAFSEGLPGVEAVRQHQPILTTLDVNLPGIDGFEVARQIRRFSTTYIIMLTALTEEVDTLMGLDAGADDYLTKPFKHRELRARIEAMLRRSRIGFSSGSPPVGSSTAPSQATAEPGSAPRTRQSSPRSPASSGQPEELPAAGWLSHNGLSINPDMRLCELDGAPLDLTRTEFDLLLAIIERNRRVVAKDDLVLELRGDLAGGYVSDADRRGVEVHMANLRRKLADSATSPRFVETVRGVGYRLATRQAESAG